MSRIPTEFKPEEIVEVLTKALSELSFTSADESDINPESSPFDGILNLPSNHLAEFSNYILSPNSSFLPKIDNLLLKNQSELLIYTFCGWFYKWVDHSIEELTSVVYSFLPTMIYIMLLNPDKEYISGIHSLFLFLYQNEKQRRSAEEYSVPNLSSPSIYHGLLTNTRADIHDKVYETLENDVFQLPPLPDIHSVTNETQSILISTLLNKFIYFMPNNLFMKGRFLDLWLSITSSFALDYTYREITPTFYPTPQTIPFTSKLILESACEGLSLIYNTDSNSISRTNSKICIKRINDFCLIKSEDFFSLKIQMYYLQIQK